MIHPGKKFVLFALSFTLALGATTLVASCGETETEHTHKFSEDWAYDADSHWHLALCGHFDEKADFGEHSWDEGVVTKEVTDKTPGNMLYTCTVCQKTKNVEIPVHVHTYAKDWTTNDAAHWHASACGHDEERDAYGTHDWNDGVLLRESTTEIPGVVLYTCTTCGMEKEEQLPLHLHSFSPDWSMDKNGHWHDAICGDTDEKQFYQDHDWNDGELVKEATTEETGLIVYTCTVCGGTLEEVIPKHVHDYESEWTFDETEHWHVSSCGHADAVADKAEHLWNDGAIIQEPTTETTGLLVRTCTVCGKEKEEILPVHVHSYSDVWSTDESAHWHAPNCTDISEPKDYSEHSFDEGVMEKQPTVDETGLFVYTCSVCGYRNEEVLPKHVHTYSDVWSTDETNHWYDPTCGDTEEKSSFGEHSWSNGLTVKEPTLTEEGLMKYTCTVCGMEKEEILPVHVHTYSDVWSADGSNHWKDPTCKDTSAPKDYAEHSFGEGVMEKKPTLDETGLLVYTCSVCGYRNEEVLPKHVHTYSDVWATDESNHWKDPTCDDTEEIGFFGEHLWDEGEYIEEDAATETGIITYTCTVCGQTRLEVATVHHHKYAEEWSFDETNHWREPICGDTEEVRGLAPHSWNEGVVSVKPTLDATGLITYTCTVCSTTKDEILPKHVHTYAETWSMDEDGHWYAPTCDDTTEIISYDVHAFDEGVVTTKPTISETGIMTYTCTVCNFKKTEILPVHQHAYADEWTFDETNHWHDPSCDDTTTVKDSAPHHWNNGVITTKPTLVDTGIKTYTCTVCSATKEEILPRHVHTYETVWTMSPEAHWHAPACDDVTEGKDYGEHSFDEGVITFKPTTTSTGIKTYTCSVCNFKKTEILPVHVHTYSETYAIDSMYHWYEPTCDDTSVVKDRNAHTFDKGTIVTPATLISTGLVRYTCTACGYTKDEILPMVEEGALTQHVFTEWTVLTAPTGSKTGRAVRYSMTDDFSEEYILPVLNSKNYSVQTVASTCLAAGVSIYYEHFLGTPVYIYVELPILPHDLLKTDAKAATCSESGRYQYYTCRTCGSIFLNVETKKAVSMMSTYEPPKGHTYGEWTVTAPTATKEGSATRTCTICKLPSSLVLPTLSSSNYSTTNDTSTEFSDGTATYHYVSSSGERVSFTGPTEKRTYVDYLVRLYNYAYDYTLFPAKTVGVQITVYTEDIYGKKHIEAQQKTTYSRESVPDSTGYLNFGKTTFHLLARNIYYVTIESEDMPEGCGLLKMYYVLGESSEERSFTIYLGQARTGEDMWNGIIPSINTPYPATVSAFSPIYFDFAPVEAGQYNITATASNGSDVLIQQYYMSGFANGAPATNQISLTVQPSYVGNSYYFSFATTKKSDITIVISKADVVVEDDVVTKISIKAEQLPPKSYAATASAMKHISMEQPVNIVYNPTDKIFHLDHANGAILYAMLGKTISEYGFEYPIGNLEKTSGYSVFTLVNASNPNVRYDYSPLVSSYTSYGAYVPVTLELKNFLQTFAVAQRYVSASGEFSNYLTSDQIQTLIKSERQWLFACYYNSTQSMGAIAADATVKNAALGTTINEAMVVRNGEQSLKLAAGQTLYCVYVYDVPVKVINSLDYLVISYSENGRVFSVKNTKNVSVTATIGIEMYIEGSGTKADPYRIVSDVEYTGTFNSATGVHYYEYTAEKDGNLVLDYDGNVSFDIYDANDTAYEKVYTEQTISFKVKAGDKVNIVVYSQAGTSDYELHLRYRGN